MTTAAIDRAGAGRAGNAPQAGAGGPATQADERSAMWVFIVGDLYIFGGWFVFYLVWRSDQQELFLRSQASLDQTLGMINTLVLLLSSWFVASAVHAAREVRHERAMRLALMTILCGVVFAGSKAHEWSSLIAEGNTFTANDFFMYYYFLTGIHLFHVFCGAVAVTVMIRNLRTPALRSLAVVENCAVFWHMVDLLWVLIFALSYLTR